MASLGSKRNPSASQSTSICLKCISNPSQAAKSDNKHHRPRCVCQIRTRQTVLPMNAILKRKIQICPTKDMILSQNSINFVEIHTQEWLLKKNEMISIQWTQESEISRRMIYLVPEILSPSMIYRKRTLQIHNLTDNSIPISTKTVLTNAYVYARPVANRWIWGQE